MGLAVIAREGAVKKHVQRSDGQPLRSPEGSSCALLFVRPGVARTSIQQDGNDNQVENPSSLFNRVIALALPRIQQILKTGATSNIKVAPSTMGRDLGDIGMISLNEGDDKLHDIIQLGVIDIEMVQLASLGLVIDFGTPLTDSLQRLEIVFRSLKSHSRMSVHFFGGGEAGCLWKKMFGEVATAEQVSERNVRI